MDMRVLLGNTKLDCGNDYTTLDLLQILNRTL